MRALDLVRRCEAGVGEGVAGQRVSHDEDEEGIEAVIHAEFGEGLGGG